MIAALTTLAATQPQIPGVVTAIAALLVGAGGATGIAALFRMGADRGKVVIEAAQGAVIVQTSVIDDLQSELTRVKIDNAQLRDRATDSEQKVVQLRAELNALRPELDALRRRVTAVEINRVDDP